MDPLRDWYENLWNGRAKRLVASIAITGEINRHFGPTWQRASVHFIFAPSDQFEVINSVPMTRELESLKFPEYPVFGFLDVAMIDSPVRVQNLRLSLTNVRIDPIDTSPLALREAGRDAGRKFVQMLNGVTGASLKARTD